MTAGDFRVPGSRTIAVAASILTGLILLVATRNFLFYFDEWDFILTAPAWTPASILEPHNEHPAMVVRLVYALLLSTVGLRSYVPYMAVLLALHATNAVLLFEVIRRRAGDLAGMAAGALLLVLGAGWENLLWAFQIGFVGSVTCGLLMLRALDAPQTNRRSALVAALAAASLMFSGVGLAFVASAAVTLLATSGRRIQALWLLPVAAALGAWYLAYGHNGTPPNPPPSVSNISRVPLYVAYGAGSAAAGLVGLGGSLGPFAGLVVLGVVAWGWWRKRQVEPFALGALAGLLAFYVVVGSTRAQLGYQQSGSGRYVYEGATFWLLLLSDAARELPWRGTWRPALVACVFLAAFNSSVVLVEYAAAKTAQMEREQSDLFALADARSDPCLDPSASVDPLVMPQVNRPPLYYRAVDEFGSPVSESDSIRSEVTRSPDFVTAFARLVKCR